MVTETIADNPQTRRTLDARLHDIAWGLLLTLTGIMWLVPAGQVPEGAWLLGVAAILIGVNLVRRMRHIPLSGFSLFLGVMALIASLSRLWGVELPLLAICFILIGLSLIAKPVLAKSV